MAEHESVKSYKQLLDEITARREAARKEFMAIIHGQIVNLREIGCGEYELVEKNGKPKIGRPRKEKSVEAKQVEAAGA